MSVDDTGDLRASAFHRALSAAEVRQLLSLGSCPDAPTGG